MAITLTTVIDDEFKERLFKQWANSTNIVALRQILADPLQDTLDVLEFILDNLSIDDAEGVFLDYMASWIGVTRPPAQEPLIFKFSRLGETNDPYNKHGMQTLTSNGGYLVSLAEGLPALDGSQMSDTDFRKLIRQKAASYRSKMTHQTLFLYLISFGARAKLTEGDHTVEIDLLAYTDLDEWTRNYLVERGYKPAGNPVTIKDNIRENLTI